MNERLRSDFPLLARRIEGRPVTYLDSAATALKPNSVLDAERAYSTQFTANIHRGKHALSEEASTAYENARRRVARHLGTDPDQVVFTRNTTESLNLVAAGLGLTAESVVVAPVSEHHSNLVPWMARAKVVTLDTDALTPLSPVAVKDALLKHHARVFTFGACSNVTGVVQDVAALCRAAREAGALSVVDAAQAAPHLPLDVEALGCDVLAFSAHKMLGPTGVGVLWAKREVLDALTPLSYGGGIVDRVTRDGFTLKKAPWKFEAGTPNVSGVLGLAAALEYLDDVGFPALAEDERMLADALERAVQDLPGVRVLMANCPSRIAVATLAPQSKKISADHLALLLSDGHGIMVRSGFHCAHPLFDHLGIEAGALRASAYLYNTVEEVERFGAALRTLLTSLGAKG